MSKRKKIVYDVMVFLIACLLLLSIFLSVGIFSGNSSVLISDAYEQYYELILYWKRILSGESSFLYTFGTSAGMSVLPTIAYYLMSPFNLIFRFIPDSQIQLWMHIVIILKIGLAGMTCFLLLSEENRKTRPAVLGVLSLCYALCGWSIGYCYEIIWLDNLYLLPLVVMGLNRIVDGKKPWLYVISVFLSIMCNYYLGYMICLFSLLYFFTSVKKKESDRKIRVSRWITFLFVSLGAGLSTMFIMWPTVRSMMSTGRMAKSSLIRLIFFPPESLAKLFFGTSDGDYMNRQYAYLYTGILPVVLSVSYFFNRGVRKEERKWDFILWIVLLVSFLFGPFYYMWHALTIPADLAGRFSFLFSLVSVMIAARAYEHLKTARTRDYVIPCVALTALAVCYFLFPVSYLARISILLTLLFSVVYLLLLASKKRSYQPVLCMLVIIEVFANGAIMMSAWKDMFGNYDVINESHDVITNIYSQIEDDSFWRAADGRNYSPLEFLPTDIHASSTFLSSLTSSFPTMVNQLGYPDSFNAYNYSDDTTEIADLFLDHKYLLTDGNRSYYQTLDQFDEQTGYEMITSENEMEKRYLQENDLVFGIGTMVASGEAEEFDKETENTLVYQNRLFQAMTGLSDNVLVEQELTGSGYEYTYQANPDTDYYLYTRFDREDAYQIKVYVNDEVYRTFDPEYTPVFLNYIHLEKNEGTVRIRIEMDGSSWHDEPKLYALNRDVFLEGVSILQNHQVTDTAIDENGKISFSANAEDGFETVYVSVPYEKGWSVYVDGQPAEVLSLYSGMMGVRLESGKHEVQFVFHTFAIKQGIILGLSGILLLLIYGLWGRKLCDLTTEKLAVHGKLWMILLRISELLVISAVFAGYFLYPDNARCRPLTAAVYCLIIGMMIYQKKRQLNKKGKKE